MITAFAAIRRLPLYPRPLSQQPLELPTTDIAMPESNAQPMNSMKAHKPQEQNRCVPARSVELHVELRRCIACLRLERTFSWSGAQTAPENAPKSSEAFGPNVPAGGKVLG